MNLEKIFLGITPANQRKFARSVLGFTVENYPTLVMPMCGSFVLAKCAIDAGYKAEDIYCSDMSLFSSVLGYLYSGQPIDSLHFKLSKLFLDGYAVQKTEVDKAAYLLWAMKIKQLRADQYYSKMYLDEYTYNAQEYLNDLAKTLVGQMVIFKGINYQVGDVRDNFKAEYDDDTIVMVDPPIYSGGYKKMFDFGEDIVWDSGVTEFDLKAEYRDWYDFTKAKQEPWLWCRYKEADEFDQEDIIFGNQKGQDRVDYWLCTKPEMLRDFPEKYYLMTLKKTELNRLRRPIFSENDKITAKSKIQFIPTDKMTALYYRDLWVHKLGTSSGESFYLLLIDDKVFGTISVLSRALLGLQTDYIFQMFAMNAPVSGEPQANRLINLLMTTNEFARFFKSTASKINRVYTLKSMHTKMFSYRRKQKIMNGIGNILSVEKNKAGLYEIVYEVPYRKQTYQQALEQYLKEEKRV